MRKVSRKVCVLINNSLSYPERPPFDPPENYPECVFKSGLDASNRIYPAIRTVFRLLGLDIKNFGTSEWSPLSGMIRKGDTVLIKPNLVYDRNLSGGSLFAVITHASLVRVIVDYSYKAAGDAGRIIVADAPQQDADFERIKQITGLGEMVEHLSTRLSIPVELCDLRRERTISAEGITVGRTNLRGDPNGYTSFDLGRQSKLAEIESAFRRFYGTDYDRRGTMSLHDATHHTYVLSGSALRSNVIINLPKLKTHMKTGITISLKNMIGLIGEKRSIVHYRVGSPSEGGDEYPEQRSALMAGLLRFNRVYCDLVLSRGHGVGLYRMMVRLGGGQSKLGSESRGSKLIHSGNWFGNDTTWRAVFDINRLALYGDRYGRVHSIPQRSMFVLVDGIVGGEGQGPLAPTARTCGTLICGANPWYVDRIAARAMGFDPRKVPVLSIITDKDPLSGPEVILSDGVGSTTTDPQNLPSLLFKPPKTWDAIRL